VSLIIRSPSLESSFPPQLRFRQIAGVFRDASQIFQAIFPAAQHRGGTDTLATLAVRESSMPAEGVARGGFATDCAADDASSVQAVRHSHGECSLYAAKLRQVSRLRAMVRGGAAPSPRRFRL